MENMSFTSWASLLALGATLGTFWKQFQSLAHWLVGIVLEQEVVKGEAATAVSAYLQKNTKETPFGLKMTTGARVVNPTNKRVELVSFRAPTSVPRLLWWGRVPMTVSTVVSHTGAGDKGVHIGDFPGSSMYPLLLSAVRGTVDIRKMIHDATAAYNHRRHSIDASGRRFRVILKGAGPFSIEQTAGSAPKSTPMTGMEAEWAEQVLSGVYALLSHNASDFFLSAADNDPFRYYAWPAEVMRQASILENWITSEKWFQDHGVPWRYGMLLVGPPGTGKTTFLVCLAKKLDMPVFQFDLAEMSNSEFSNAWREAQAQSPCMVLMEDFDNVFKGRENISKTTRLDKGALTFDCLLNTVAGASDSHGVVLAITTNSPEHIDPAICQVDSRGLLTRPGRIDAKINFSVMTEAERWTVARVIMAEWPEEVSPLVLAGSGDTAAQFQSRCVVRARELFFRQERK